MRHRKSDATARVPAVRTRTRRELRGLRGFQFASFLAPTQKCSSQASAWRNYEVVLDVPPEATGIFLGILLDGTGTVWISGAKFEETNLPTTDKLNAVTSRRTLHVFAANSGTGKLVTDPAGARIVAAERLLNHGYLLLQD